LELPLVFCADRIEFVFQIEGENAQNVADWLKFVSLPRNQFLEQCRRENGVG